MGAGGTFVPGADCSSRLAVVEAIAGGQVADEPIGFTSYYRCFGISGSSAGTDLRIFLPHGELSVGGSSVGAAVARVRRLAVAGGQVVGQAGGTSARGAVAIAAAQVGATVVRIADIDARQHELAEGALGAGRSPHALVAGGRVDAATAAAAVGE